MKLKFILLFLFTLLLFFGEVAAWACGAFPAPYLCTAPTVPAISCGNPVYPSKIISKDSELMSIEDGGYDPCVHLKYWAYKNSYYTDTAFYRAQYDSLRYYIQSCIANDNYYPDYIFTNIDNAVQLMSKDTTRYDTYRAWLISVLYLNTTNPAYFCSCLGSIGNTYQYGKYRGIGYLAVENYFKKYQPCGWDSATEAQYQKDSTDAVRYGDDPTHLPPLDSLGLGFLLKNSVATSPGILPSIYLASFTSSPNPFKKETTLEFTLNRMAYVQVAVYDELGKLVWGNGRGSSLEAGTHQIHLDGSAFPSGVFYARISTGFGEVKTVKLVHEK